MERSTNEQRNFKDAMIILIDLYYYLKKVKEKSFLSEPVIKKIAKLFHKTIPNFSPCIYYPMVKSFCYRADGDRINLTKNITWHPATTEDLEGLYQFIDMMNALVEDLKNGTYDIIKITHAEYISKLGRNMRDLPHVDFSKSDPDILNKLRNYDWLNSDASNKFQHKTKYIKNNPKISYPQNLPYYKDVYLNEPPLYYESFYFIYDVNSNFFKSFWENIGKANDFISSPDNTYYFFDVIKFILVKYVSLFGSFNRIKVCKKCGKLIYEIKSGSKIYCNDDCRVNFNVAAEPKDIYDCRARQNGWLYRKLKTPDTIKKDECENCQENRSLMKGGMCPKVQEKNEVKLTEQNKQPKIRHTI